MSFPLIPRHDPILATRVKRQIMAFLSGLMYVPPAIYAVEQGWIRFGYTGLALLTLASMTVNGAFLIAIRSGLTRRFRDPSLIVPQVAAAGLLALVLAFYSDKATIVALALFFSSFFFGVFSFSLRQYLTLTGAVAVAYGSMLLLKYDVTQRSTEAFQLELLDYLVLVMVLLWMSLLGSYIASLRVKLSQQKDALAIALGRLKELASRDELTGLHNRRHLMDALGQQFERARRHAEPFSLAILDLDLFKQINDTWGHGVGDEVLCGFAERIRSGMRGIDVLVRGDDDTEDSTFGRYGGEEFLLLMPYAAASGALVCVERLRCSTREQPFPTSVGGVSITFSAGIAHHRPGETIAALIQRADDALYRAKTAGRDRIETAH